MDSPVCKWLFFMHHIFNAYFSQLWFVLHILKALIMHRWRYLAKISSGFYQNDFWKHYFQISLNFEEFTSSKLHLLYHQLSLPYTCQTENKPDIRRGFSEEERSPAWKIIMMIIIFKFYDLPFQLNFCSISKHNYFPICYSSILPINLLFNDKKCYQL